MKKGKEDPPAPWEKGSTVETKQELLEKGKEVTAPSEEPLEKGKEVTAPSEEPLEKGKEVTAPSEEPLEKGNFEVAATKKEPLEKGTAPAASSASPLEKGKESAAPREEPLKKGKVMVDFYNVLFLGSTIPPGSLSAILLLQENGYQPVICSFCGKEREKEVFATLQKYELLKNLELICTNQRTGNRSKGSICVSEQMVALFDDSADILQDALEKGIEIYPIKAPYQHHWWWSKLGGTAYDSLRLAVEAFLNKQGAFENLKKKMGNP